MLLDASYSISSSFFALFVFFLQHFGFVDIRDFFGLLRPYMWLAIVQVLSTWGGPSLSAVCGLLHFSVFVPVSFFVDFSTTVISRYSKDMFICNPLVSIRVVRERRYAATVHQKVGQTV